MLELITELLAAFDAAAVGDVLESSLRGRSDTLLGDVLESYVRLRGSVGHVLESALRGWG
jgi:regulator of RNase E activity RraA